MPAQNYGPILTRFHQIPLNENPWLWPGRIPLGAITTLVGYGGEGKSFLACSIACAVSRGGPLPDGSPAPHGAVVVMAGEDLPSKLRLRYEANGADLEKLALLQGQRIYTKNGPVEANITLRDIDLIRAAVDDMSQTSPQTASEPTPVKLLIIDPIGDFIPGVNSDKDNEVRALLNPISQLAQERELAVLLICHRKKGAGDRADNAALGSVAFTSKARAVHHVILDPYDTAHPAKRRRLFLPGKLNDQQQTQGLAFKILSPNGPGSVGTVEWEKEPITHSADAIMQYASAKSKAERASDPTALTETEAWLRDALKSGPRPATEIIKQARSEGIAVFTLRSAKQRLGVTHTRLPLRGVYVWESPQPSNQPGEKRPREKLDSELVLAAPQPTQTNSESAKATNPTFNSNQLCTPQDA